MTMLKGIRISGSQFGEQAIVSSSELGKDERLFVVQKENAEAWLKALAKNDVAASLATIPCGWWLENWDGGWDVESSGIKTVVRTRISGSQFHKIGILEGVIPPKNSRDRKILAKNNP